MDAEVRQELQERVEGMRRLPSSPEVLEQLLQMLRRPPEQIEFEGVVELIGYDQSIAAQCLRIANSPLYTRSRGVESIRAAVLSLGSQRVEDVLLACCLDRMGGSGRWPIEPQVYWKHALACAAVCRELAKRVGYAEPERAYLAGLLHDVGILVNVLAYGDRFRRAVDLAWRHGKPLDEEESLELGFTHGESGAALAESWELPGAIVEAIRHHHEIADASAKNPLVSLVHLADLLCRSRGLGYGYEEARRAELALDPAWDILAEHCPRLATMDLGRLVVEMEAYLPRVGLLVESVFLSKAEHVEAGAGR